MITENRLMQQCYMYFHNTYPHLRGLFFRIKNEDHNRISGAINKATGVIPGVADSVFLVPNRKPVFIEFKTETGKQSQSQHEWSMKVVKAGCSYFICRSLDEFKNIICQFT